MVTEDLGRDWRYDFEGALQAVEKGETPEALPHSYLNQLVTAHKAGISTRQCMVCFNKWLHGFKCDDINGDLALLVGEVSELMLAVCSGTVDEAVKELADIAIYCYGLANILGKDLDKAIGDKIEYNLNRIYN